MLIEFALIMQRHPFFRGIEWETLRQQRAPFEPVVMHELDTRNFDHFDEEISPSSTSARRRYGRVDRDFIGYTYKSYDAVKAGPAAGAQTARRCIEGCCRYLPPALSVMCVRVGSARRR